jgi:multiple sugar transport system substrate-binding protein
MKHTRKIFNICFLSLLVCLTAGLLFACSDLEPASETTTISFVHDSDDTEYYQPLVEQFHIDHPSIVVELIPSGRNELETHTDADTFALDLFTYAVLNGQDALLDLTPLVDVDPSFERNDFYPNALEAFNDQGRQLALPAGIDVMVLFYNQAIFDTLGLAYPDNEWNWNNLQETALEIRDEDTQLYGFAVPEFYLDLVSMMLIYQRGGKIYNNFYEPTRVTFNDPLNIEALEWFASLYHKLDVAPTPEQARIDFGVSGQNAVTSGIFDGKVGLWPGWFSNLWGWTQRSELEIPLGVVPFPYYAQTATGTRAFGYGISTQTESPGAAWEWISFLGEQIPPTMIPARISVAKSDAYQQIMGQDLVDIATQALESSVMIPFERIGFEAEFELFSQAVEDIVAGTADVVEVLDSIQTEIESGVGDQ